MVTIALLALVGLVTISVTTFYTELRRGLRYASAPPGFRPLTIAEAAAFAASALGSLVATTACRLIPGLGHARRRWSERAFSRGDARALARDTKPFSCPRCRAGSRGPEGFCTRCLAELNTCALDVNAPVVRAAVSAERSTDPELVARRRAKIVRGDIGGWAPLIPASQECAYDVSPGAYVKEARGGPSHAWRDPADGARVWICLSSGYELVGGRVFEGRTIALAIYDGGKLAALWTMSPFEWRERPAGAPAAEAPPSQLA